MNGINKEYLKFIAEKQTLLHNILTLKKIFLIYNIVNGILQRNVNADNFEIKITK